MRAVPKFGTGGHILSILATVLVISCNNFAWGDEEFKPVFNPTINISRVQGEIKIDGKLNDSGWKTATTTDKFVENYPGDQIKPPVETRVFITYDNDRLYVAFLCYDNPKDIRTSLRERDMINTDDNAVIMLDTYGDGMMAYFLKVNPYGIQGDDLWSLNYGQDASYDLIWESAGQITDSGFQVEMAVPFSSLRFPRQEKQTWRIDFWRNHRRGTRHKISWAARDRDDPCFACQWGYLTGIEGVSPGKGIEIIAAVTGTQSGEHGIYSTGYDSLGFPLIDSMKFVNDDVLDDYSIGIKYNISSNITSEIFINPDYSQVEADADQIDVNSTTALYFPEKRPFFQEGSDLFRTSFDVVHTRMINDPFIAAKTTARLGKTSIAYLAAMDEKSPLIIPFEEFSSPELLADTSFSNILRVNRSLGSSSYIGLLLTDRRFKQGGSGTAIAVDGISRLTKNFQFKYQGIKSFTNEPNDPHITKLSWEKYRDDLISSPYHYQTFTFDDKHTPAFDGEKFSGHAFLGELRYSARDLTINGDYRQTNPTLRFENGFLTKNNMRRATMGINYTYRFEGDLLEYMMAWVGAEKQWNTDGFDKFTSFEAMYEAVLKKAQIHFMIQYRKGSERYSGIEFDNIWKISFHHFNIPSDRFSCGGLYEISRQIARSALTMADAKRGWLWVDVKPIDRLLIESNINYTKAEHAETKKELWDGYIVRSKMSLNFNRELSLRFVTQYNDFVKTWDFDPLLTYRLSPFSLFYIGSTYDYDRLYLDTDKTKLMNQGDYEKKTTRLRSRQFFMKLQYMFQM
ncbi:MAG: carbohydrate binding family 9 domain-containing protein [candidate division Zixibacteria bacterium]